MIKGAPFAFTFVCVVAVSACLGGFRWFYHEKLTESETLANHWKSEADYWRDVASHPSQTSPPAATQPVQGKPIPPKIVTRTLPAPEFGTQVVHRENFIPGDSKYGSGLRLTLATDQRRGPVQLLIICDGDIGLAPSAGKSSKSGVFVVESQMLMPGHPEVWNVKWRTPEWTPGDTIMFEFLSKKKIDANAVIPITYNPNAQ